MCIYLNELFTLQEFSLSYFDDQYGGDWISLSPSLHLCVCLSLIGLDDSDGDLQFTEDTGITHL